MTTDQSNGTASLLNSLSLRLTPFEQSFSYGADRSDLGSLLNEQNDWRDTTGSGPVNPSIVQPGSIFDMLFGNPVARQNTTSPAAPAAGGGVNPMILNLAIIGIVAVVAWWLWKRFA